jgi:hypothetical protein
LFDEIAAEKYKPFASMAVIEEFEKITPEKSKNLLGIIGKFSIDVVAVDDEANKLADIYVSDGLMPQKFRIEALHI